MYEIKNIINEKSYTLHNQRAGKLKVIEPRLSLSLNKTGALTFKITPLHPYYDTLKKLNSVIEVYEDKELIYEGRILTDEKDFYNVKSIGCEGSLSYLIDSIQRPFSISGNIKSFLSKMIETHNSQVEARKQFELGLVNIADENNELVRTSTSLDKTWNILKKFLLDIHGGYLWVQYSNGKKILNYTYDLGGYNEQPIRFGDNLLDLTQYQDATNIITCLIPYGADYEYQDALGETQEATTDITSVNNGKDYIEADPDIIAEHGYIWGTYKWEDISDPARLLQVSKQYLNEASGIPDSLTVKALDLAYTGVDIRRFKLGRYTKCISKPHDINKDLLLSKLDIYLDDPSKGSISLGSTTENFTGATVNKQVTISKDLQNASDELFATMVQKIANATTLITGGFGGYVVLDNINPSTGEKMHPWRILVMNTPDKDTAQNIIQINQNGIGFSTTGINGPYRNAWTIDGNLVADFITTGTMLADRIRGGTLEVGGSGIGKDGVIKILDASGSVLMEMSKTGIIINSGTLNSPKIESGTINTSTIVGGSADFGDGLFYADDSEVGIGGFYARTAWGRDILQSNDGQCGLSANPGSESKLWIWAGWQSADDYDFVVNNAGEVHARDFVIKDGYSITGRISQIEADIDELRREIENLDTGGIE